MTRKDPAQDTERPHFYSQFWIDVAMGKRDVTSNHADSEADIEDFGDEDLGVAPVEVAPRPATKPKVARPERKPEPTRPTFNSLADLANIDLLMKNSEQMEGDEGPDLETSAIDDLAPFQQAPANEEPIVTNFDIAEAEPELAATDEEDENLEDFDFEDEDEDEWGGGRKPGKGGKLPPRKRRTGF